MFFGGTCPVNGPKPGIVRVGQVSGGPMTPEVPRKGAN